MNGVDIRLAIQHIACKDHAQFAGPYASGAVLDLAQHCAGPARRQFAGTNKLTLSAAQEHTDFKCLKSRLQSGMSLRQSVAFFSPIISSVGKGETVRNGGLLGSVRDFNTLTPPLTLEIVSGGFQSHRGAHHG